MNLFTKLENIELLKNEYETGYGIILPDGRILFDCLLCISHSKFNALFFYVHFTMEDDGRRIAAISLMRDKTRLN